MKIVIANDHRGVTLKKEIMNYLIKNNYTVENLGVDTEETADYPNYAFKLGEKIKNNEADFGILICGTGIGMSIAANKVKKVRCALVHNENEAKLTREHNNANVIALSADKSFLEAKNIIDIFLNTPFSDEERHVNRINLITSYEDNNA